MEGVDAVPALVPLLVVLMLARGLAGPPGYILCDASGSNDLMTAPSWKERHHGRDEGVYKELLTSVVVCRPTTVEGVATSSSAAVERLRV